jgi:ubiquinol oxidase
VEQVQIDLKKEQQASRARPRYPYSAVARVFFGSMDMLTGKKTTLAKAKLVEILAPVPYRAWERRERGRVTRHQADGELGQEAGAIMRWGKEAQDSEHWHLLLIEEKIREDSAKEPWYLSPPLPSLMVGPYALLTWAMARVAIRRALVLNGEFEDHAEHTYAQLVQDHPEWEDQPVKSTVVQGYGSFRSWADVFRRVGLDERDMMNNSLVFAGRPEHVVEYEGMPAPAGAGPQAG